MHRKVLLGICGSIAAYKSAYLVRLLVKQGADVRVILTPSAAEFVSPLTFATLSRNPALTEFYSRQDGEWNNHVDLGMWADLLLIAPATAQTIAKMACGMCDNLLMAVYLSARCPVAVAPAMDADMYAHPATRANLSKLVSFGNLIIPPAAGELASGITGEGRMAEPEEIIRHISSLEKSPKKKSTLNLAGKKVLVTAGPTQEPIDPVRFIGNRSSGKMGFALASAAAQAGAEVTLISGPVSLETPHPSVKRIDVTTAAEMHRTCMQHFPKSDVTIMSAAVADFTPAKKYDKKLKKSVQTAGLDLLPTRDILLEMGRKKKKGQVLVGFALETDNGVASARKKLKEKNLDLIVLNSLQDKGAGFGYDTNRVTFIGNKGIIKKTTLLDKSIIAEDILEYVHRTFLQEVAMKK